MIKSTFILLACLLAINLNIFIDAKCERNNSISVKTFKINLDLHPSMRFNEVSKHFKEEILTLFESEK
jgi:hypothetical protein